MPARPKVRCGQDEEPALRIEIPVFSARDGEVVCARRGVAGFELAHERPPRSKPSVSDEFVEL
jgi:hypothetical protein